MLHVAKVRQRGTVFTAFTHCRGGGDKQKGWSYSNYRHHGHKNK